MFTINLDRIMAEIQSETHKIWKGKKTQKQTFPIHQKQQNKFSLTCCEHIITLKKGVWQLLSNASAKQFHFQFITIARTIKANKGHSVS